MPTDWSNLASSELELAARMKAYRPSPDDHLLDALIKQDRKAQWQLFRNLQRKMLALCRRYLKDDFQAENCMMQGFAKVFESASSFRNEGSLEGWVKKIMVRQCLMELRKNRQFRMEDLRVYEDDFSVDLQEPLDYSILLEFVRKLPDGCRAVFNLFALEGYSHPEIARMLEISEGTSRSQLAAARFHLKKMLQQAGIYHANYFSV